MLVINALFTVYTWAVVGVLLYFTFIIARFYERKSGIRSYYHLFLVPIILFGVASIRYAIILTSVAGDFWGDLLRFGAGVIVSVAMVYLLNLMVGGRS